MLVEAVSQRGEETTVEGEGGTKGAGVAVMEKKKVDPSPGTPVLRNWKRKRKKLIINTATEIGRIPLFRRPLIPQNALLRPIQSQFHRTSTKK
jgi:hypothetical protein